MSDQNQFLLYTAPDGAVKVDVFLKDETVWLTQKALAELFGVQVPGINKHLKNIFESGELVEASVISILETTAADGKNYQTRYYNLDAIIAVGYRVNSYQATQFRIWATKTLREFIIKGFVLDDERLKQGKQVFGKDYFDELLERIREIRASERRFYQKITDIYALSVDYSADASVTKEFFATVQNKIPLGLRPRDQAVGRNSSRRAENTARSGWNKRALITKTRKVFHGQHGDGIASGSQWVGGFGGVLCERGSGGRVAGVGG